MKKDTDNQARTSGKLFRAEYESRFGNMPEFGARVLCAEAENFHTSLWVPVLDDLALSDGFSPQKKPMIHDIKRSLARIISKKNSAKASDRERQREKQRDSTAATPVEVETILAATEAGGASLSAWICKPGRLSVASRPGALEIIADAFRVSTAWANWAIAQLEAGIAAEEIRSQIDPVLSDAAPPSTDGGNLIKAFAAAATTPERTDPLRTTGEGGRPLKRADR